MANTPLTEAEERKQHPVWTGFLNYFPDAVKEVAYLSWVCNEQHNPGTEVHWDRTKSKDHKDALGRHLIDAGTLDTDGMRHSTKVAWRALALLQKELEDERTKHFKVDAGWTYEYYNDPVVTVKE